MTSLIEQIRELKTEAKNQRDRGLKGYPRALARLAEAIKLAQGGLDDTTVPDVARQMAKELADCHGINGGVERRWGLEGDSVGRFGHLAASCNAYDAGHRYEWDERYNIRDSYNLVNRLTGRLLIRPELLRSEETADLGGGIQALNLPQALSRAMADIEEYLAKKGNFWAEADLALLNVLIKGVEASSAYTEFCDLKPPGYAYTSALDGLRPLAALPFDTAPALRAAVALLETRRPAG
jgi:hypothetical protein